MAIAIRDVRENELDSVLALNNAAGETILPLDAGRMRDFFREAAYFRVAEADGHLAGFLIGLREDAQYGSANFLWFRERYAEFLDRVKAYAYFPYAVVPNVENFTGGEITVSFEGLSGRIDQGAGILFNLKPNGDYLTIRANCLENNLVLWKFEKGKRSSVKWVRNTPTATKQWHELKVRVTGTKVEGYLDGKLYLEDTLAQPVSGRIGLWSKADSHVYFSDYIVATAD